MLKGGMALLGSILLWFFLSLLTLLLLLLLLPVVLSIHWRAGVLTVKAWILFVPVTLVPAKERKAKPRKKKRRKEKPEEAEQKKEPTKRTMEDWLRLIRRVASSARPGLRFLLRHVRITAVELVLPVHTGEAAETALETGRMQGIVGGARALLANAVNISYKQLQVVPDFTGEMQDETFFSCKVVASPVIIVAVGVIVFRHFLASGRRGRAKRKTGRAAPPVSQDGSPGSAVR